MLVADCGGDPTRLDRSGRSDGWNRRALTRGDRRRSRNRPLPAVARQLGFATVSYGTLTGPSERNVTKRARRAFTPAVPLGLAQRMDRSPREHQPEASRASPAVVRNQLAPRPHARGPQRRHRVSAARTAYYLLPHAVGPARCEPWTRPRPLDAPREAISRLAESWAGPPRPARYRRKRG